MRCRGRWPEATGCSPAPRARLEGWNPQLSLEGKTALVTGASRGIGLAWPRRFVQAGAKVMISSRPQRTWPSAVSDLGSPRRPGGQGWPDHAAHVGRPDEAVSCVDETVRRFGSLDVLVNNAGTNPYFGPMIDIDLVRAQKTFEVNQLSVLVWTGRRRQGGLRGSVINIASVGGLEVEPNIGWYNVTKAAVLHITRQLRVRARRTSG